jgi:hypothetical protein
MTKTPKTVSEEIIRRSSRAGLVCKIKTADEFRRFILNSIEI